MRHAGPIPKGLLPTPVALSPVGCVLIAAARFAPRGSVSVPATLPAAVALPAIVPDADVKRHTALETFDLDEVDRIRPEPYLALSQILAKQGDSEGSAAAEAEFKRWSNFDRQLSALTQAANQNPKDAKALFKLGEQYFAGEKWNEALEWFQRSIYVDPKNAHAHFYCGILRRKLGDHAAATNHLKEAEFLEPDSLDPKLELIRLYAETSDENGIQEVFKKVETEAAEDPVAMRELGIVCAEVGRAEDARRFLDKAIALDDKDVEAHLALAGFLAKSGDADAARAAYQRVLELDPTNAAAQAGLADGTGGEQR